MPRSPCMGYATSARFWGLLGPKLYVLGGCLSLMAPVFTLYYSPDSSEKESWERSEWFCPSPPPSGCSRVSGDITTAPSSLGWRDPRGAEAPTSARLPSPASHPSAPGSGSQHSPDAIQLHAATMQDMLLPGMCTPWPGPEHPGCSPSH